MSPDLVEFLRARLDEDEDTARRATEGPWRYDPRKQWHLLPEGIGAFSAPEEFVAAGPMTDPTCVAATGPADNLESMADAGHIARWDPARVLAEVAAKRGILRRLETHARALDPASPVGDAGYRTAAGYRHSEATMIALLLAQPYAGHPDYDERWRS